MIDQSASDVSDAIEEELRRLEQRAGTGRPRALRPLLRIGAFIGRPDTMTALATAAAALAAFLSLWTAARQEKAMFDSALLIKQDDIMASFEEQSAKSQAQLRARNRHLYPSAPTQADMDYYDATISSLKILEDMLPKMDLVMPESVTDYDTAVTDDLDALVDDFNDERAAEIALLHNDPAKMLTPAQVASASRKLDTDFGNLVQHGFNLYECLALPLKNGRNIEGKAFARCEAREK